MSAPTLAASSEPRGLSATPFEGSSLDLLRRLDHPVAIPLAPDVDRATDAAPRAASDSQRWLAVVGFEGDRARVAGLLPGEVVTVGLERRGEPSVEHDEAPGVEERAEGVRRHLAEDSGELIGSRAARPRSLSRRRCSGTAPTHRDPSPPARG